MRYVVQIVGDKTVARDLEKIASQLGRSVDDVLDQSADAIESTMKSKSPSFTGELKRSIKVFKKTEDERWIGPTTGISTRFPPSRYGKYVDQGGGPSGLPNVQDVALRLGIGTREAFAFAKYLRDTGKAVQKPSWFVRDTARQGEEIFFRIVQSYLNQIIK